MLLLFTSYSRPFEQPFHHWLSTNFFASSHVDDVNKRWSFRLYSSTQKRNICPSSIIVTHSSNTTTIAAEFTPKECYRCTNLMLLSPSLIFVLLGDGDIVAQWHLLVDVTLVGSLSSIREYVGCTCNTNLDRRFIIGFDCYCCVRDIFSSRIYMSRIWFVINLRLLIVYLFDVCLFYLYPTITFPPLCSRFIVYTHTFSMIVDEWFSCIVERERRAFCCYRFVGRSTAAER